MVDAPESPIDVAEDTESSEAKRVLDAFQAELDRARELIVQGDREGALQLCLGVLDKEDLPVRIAATLSLIMRDLNQTKTADHIKQVLLKGLEATKDQLPTSSTGLLERAEIYADLHAFEEAEELCRKALELNPGNLGAVNALITFLTMRDKHDEAKELALGYGDIAESKFDSLYYFASVFGYLKCNDIVADLLDEAEAICSNQTDKAKLDHLRAANKQSAKELDQHGMAVGIFDSFAENYDTHLAKIKNNGPSMIYTALEELALPKTKTRRILDAGCGTGLCAEFLRQYAKEIVGADVSVKMLEKAREKKLYDFLSRTDLSIPVTFPEGTFDMVVAADVLVYFGTLNTVFENFQAVLNPGGWLIFTVETETDDDIKSGFKLYPSGRHKHNDPYILRTLTQAGFPKPKFLKHGRLRNEMGKPVLGTIVAVQKPALLFG